VCRAYSSEFARLKGQLGATPATAERGDRIQQPPTVPDRDHPDADQVLSPQPRQLCARYDAGRLTSSLASLRVPVMALQTTFLNEKNERMSLREGQTTPYIDMLRANVPSVRVEIITDTGHFPQLDESARTNVLIDTFLASVHVA